MDDNYFNTKDNIGAFIIRDNSDDYIKLSSSLCGGKKKYKTNKKTKNKKTRSNKRRFSIKNKRKKYKKNKKQNKSQKTK